jgi:predicted Zn-ribbon and HTH transcriptional regulator
MAKAAKQVRNIFTNQQQPLTLSEIRKFSPELKASEISMALSHYTKAKHLTHVLIPNPNARGRRQIKQYTWHSEKVSNENN